MRSYDIAVYVRNHNVIHDAVSTTCGLLKRSTTTHNRVGILYCHHIIIINRDDSNTTIYDGAHDPTRSSAHKVGTHFVYYNIPYQ